MALQKTAEPKPRNKGGRPPIAINLEELEKLAALGCTQVEAAAWFNVSLRTIKSKLDTPECRAAWEAGQGKGKVSLRRLQLKLAEKSAAMAIFLGKNQLGQSDRNEVTVSGGDTPIRFTLIPTTGPGLSDDRPGR